MSITERVHRLELPLAKVVVIGSGVLDALGLRPAGDVDLVMSADLFASIVKNPDWQVSAKHNELVASCGDTEAFLSWGSDGRPNFQELAADAITIDDVQFAHPAFVRAWKLQRGSDKDLADVELLDKYEAERRER